MPTFSIGMGLETPTGWRILENHLSFSVSQFITYHLSAYEIKCYESINDIMRNGIYDITIAKIILSTPMK